VPTRAVGSAASVLQVFAAPSYPSVSPVIYPGWIAPSAAPLGEMDFVVNGVMIGGFALVAAPAEYRVTGVNTFMVSHDGVVYQKDLGPASLEEFKKVERFNPDKTWIPVPDEIK